MTTSSSKHVLINGAGLAGLALSIGLARRNISSTIFEIRSKPQTIGGAIALAPNALRVLEKTIGIEIRQCGFQYERMQFVTDDGLEIGSVVNGSRSRFGYPALRVNRTTLHEALLEEATKNSEKISIRWNSTISTIEESPSHVQVRLQNGSTVEGNLVVGADGIHSKIREHVLGKSEAPTPEYSGMFGIGGTISRDEVDWGSCSPPAMVFTRKGTMLAIPTNEDGTRIGWAIQREMEEKTREEWQDYISSGEALKDAQNHFGPDPSPPIRDMLYKTSQETIRGWPPYSIPDLKTWHKARVVLIGDAAHAIPPYTGQGAGQAFEDAGFLSRLLSERDDCNNDSYESALQHFEKVRKQRFDKIRQLTTKSGTSRNTNLSSLGWMFKKYSMWLYFSWKGDGVLPTEEIYAYDVDKEELM